MAQLLMNRQDIKTLILQTKQKLIEFEETQNKKGEDVYIGMHPVNSIELETFPLDFQIFMEEIGELSVSWHQYQVLEIRMPYPMEEIDESESGDIMAGDLWLPWSFYPENGLYFGKPFKNYQIFAGESCSYTMYSFDTSSKPYKIIDQDGGDCGTFIEWFKLTMNEHIDYTYLIKNYF